MLSGPVIDAEMIGISSREKPNSTETNIKTLCILANCTTLTLKIIHHQFIGNLLQHWDKMEFFPNF